MVLCFDEKSPLYFRQTSKRLILTVWRKSQIDCPKKSRTPMPHEDTQVGFVLVCLQTTTLPLCNWYKVTDNFGRQCGSLQIRITANEDIAKYANRIPAAAVSSDIVAADVSAIANVVTCDVLSDRVNSDVQASEDAAAACTDDTAAVSIVSAKQTYDAIADVDSDSLLGINSSALDETIKRKFTELEDISKRLKSRLGDVTDLANFDDVIDDVMDAEFEQYLNTMPDENDGLDEDDFDWFRAGENIANEIEQQTLLEQKDTAKSREQQTGTSEVPQKSANESIEPEQQEAGNGAGGELVMVMDSIL